MRDCAARSAARTTCSPADQFRDLGDCIIPAAIIPMYTPEEAIEEWSSAVRQLGYKVVMLGGLIRQAGRQGQREPARALPVGLE
jgi:hypothetical protein